LRLRLRRLLTAYRSTGQATQASANGGTSQRAACLIANDRTRNAAQEGATLGIAGLAAAHVWIIRAAGQGERTCQNDQHLSHKTSRFAEPEISSSYPTSQAPAKHPERILSRTVVGYCALQ
jgi:hypothetical protein